MYQRILVALDRSEADKAVLPHVAKLAALLKSRLLLVHVADGWVARNFEQLELAASEEMKDDWRYLNEKADELRKETGLDVETRLALGDPPAKIVHVAEEEGCDLIAMASHGHRLLADLVLGETIDKVRHKTRIPLLVVRAEDAAAPAPG